MFVAVTVVTVILSDGPGVTRGIHWHIGTHSESSQPNLFMNTNRVGAISIVSKVIQRKAFNNYRYYVRGPLLRHYEK